jgi:YD repeat-containing protein
MKKFFFFSLLILLASSCFAQPTLDEVKQHSFPRGYTMSSPEAAGMTKVVDIPVDLPTGRPSINIPIYTINTGKQTVPIYLTYDAGGIKVGQNASAVGLGWSLVAGGAITRTIRDKDDLMAAFHYEDIGGLTWDGSSASVSGQNATQQDVSFKVCYQNGDALPDLYMFNASNDAGRFVWLGNTLGYKTLPKQDYYISSDLSANTWKIVNSSGTIFNFGGIDATGNKAYEQTNVVTRDNNPGASSGLLNELGHVSAWQLTSMSNFDGSDIVNFTYHQTYTEQFGGGAESIIFGTIGNTSTTFTTSVIRSAITHSLSHQINGQIIDKISFNGGVVEFHSVFNSSTSSSARQDLVSGVGSAGGSQPRLNEIVVKDAYGNIVRRVALDYDYFNASTGDISMERLKLLSVTIWNSSAVPEVYKFDYNEAVSLPSKISKAIDHWGYYNGATTNNTLIPKYNVRSGSSATSAALVTPSCPYSPSPNSSAVYNGADREPNSAYTSAGILTKITYPTGGTASFDYESNTISAYPETHYVPSNVNTSVTLLRELGSGPDIVWGAGGSFTIPSNARTVSGVTLMLATSISVAPGSDGHVVSSLFLDGLPSIGVSARSTAPSECQTFTLYPGSYEWVNQIDPHGVDYGATAQFHIKIDYPTSLLTDVQASGLRVKKITHDNLQGGTQISNYSYNIPSTPTLSSGYTHRRVTYDHYVRTGMYYTNDVYYCPECYDPTHDWIPCAYAPFPKMVLQSSTDWPVGIGPEVLYKYVTVTKGDGSNGKEIFEHYVANSDYLPWEDGKIVHHSYLDASNQLVRDEIYNYSFSPIVPGSNIFYGYDIIDFGTHPCWNPDISTISLDNPYPIIYAFGWRPVPISLEWMKLSSKTTNEYFASGTISQTESYSYDDQTLALKSVSKNVTNGTRKTYFVHANDYPITSSTFITDEVSAISTLKSAHADEEVLETYTTLNDKVTGSSFISRVPLSIGALNGIVQSKLYNIETQQALSSFSPSSLSSTAPMGISIDPNYKLNATVTQYNSRLNPTEIINEHGDSIALIYLYSGDQVAAKAIHALQKQIAYSSFECPGEKGNWAYDEANVSLVDAITGHKCYVLNSGLSFSVAGGYGTPGPPNCIVSYWKKGTVGVKVNGNDPTLVGNITVNGWTYCEHKVDANTGVNLVADVGSSPLIDEVRVYPLRAQMETECYDPLVGVTDKVDVNNQIIHFKYDGLGRLILQTDQFGNITKKYEYGIQTTE